MQDVWTYVHHSSDPDYIIIHDLLRDGDPGDVTLAAEVHVATEVVFDVLHPLGEDRFSVRHRLVNLCHPVFVVFRCIDLPCSVSTRRTTYLLNIFIHHKW